MGACGALAEETITLTIASAMVTEVPEGGLQQELADKFMELHPNVKIEFISVPAVEMSKRMLVLAANDDLPDMFFVPNDFMAQLATLDIVADLEGLLGQEFLDGYNQNLLEDAKINGKMMCVPWYASPYAVIYRLDWFEELGLSIPKTWDEFVEAGKQMVRDTDGGGKAWAFSMVGAYNSSGEQRFTLVTKTFGVDEVYQDENGVWVSDIFDPRYKDALAMFTELYTKHGIVPPGPTEVDYAASMQLFTSEQTGMILSGPHSLGFITRTNPDLEGKLGSFVIPMQENHISTSGIGGYTIMEACEHKDVAAEYLAFLTLPENAVPFGQGTGRMPTRLDAQGDPFFNSPLFSGFLEAFNYCAPMKSFPGYLALMDAVGESYSTVLAGSATVDEAYERLCAKTEAILAEYNE